jgi:hypothetical protein
MVLSHKTRRYYLEKEYKEFHGFGRMGGACSEHQERATRVRLKTGEGSVLEAK